MRASHVVVVLALASACSDPASKPDAARDDGATPDASLDPGAKSGTRLKLRHYDFGNVRELLGIHDSVRAEDCAPAEFSNGKTYCMPRDTRSLVYADSACTQPIGLTFESDSCVPPLPAYFAEYDQAPCLAKMARLFRRGAVITRSGHYARGANGTCVVGGTSATDVYHALTEVPLSELAALTVSAPSPTGRLGTRYHESVDGMRFPVANELHDSVLGGRCTPWSYAAAPTVGTCLPKDVAYVAGFTDATCTQHHATTLAGCAAPSAAVSYETCRDDPPHFYAVSAKQTPTMIYTQSGSMCLATPPYAGSTYYDMGAELTVATMARETATGSDRLQPIHFTTPEGLHIRDRGLMDGQLGALCYPTTQANGSVVCVPNGTAWQTMYTDAACTNAVELVPHFRAPTCAPGPAPLYAVTAEPASACQVNKVVRRVGAQYTGTAYQRFGATCSPYSSTIYVLYRVAEVIPDSALAAGTLVTD